VTIGQGPRWHYKDVDTAVEEFLEENRGSWVWSWYYCIIRKMLYSKDKTFQTRDLNKSW
jgi:hypothetical protein